MSEIIIYTKDSCPYCERAKTLLKKKGVTYTELKITDDKTREEMIERSGGRMTVPQIFINDKHIGGCDDLYALDAEGGLDDLLK